MIGDMTWTNPAEAKAYAEGRAEERKVAAAYLRHVATVEVGSILSKRGREIVEWCASWLENGLHAKEW